MKANELRIGNLIEVNGKHCEVTNIIPPNIIVDTDEYFKAFSINQINPIPLTEEWLVKFGFTCNTIDSKQYDRYFELGDISVCLHVDNHEPPSISSEVNDWFLDVDISQVHKLQNLYFALTGEEL